MLFKIILGNLDWKILFVVQPWSEACKITLIVIFVKKNHESVFKS